MASRRDQLHSYQFMMQRVISSVVLRETDPEQAPLRRGVGAIFGSVMLAAVLAAGLGVYTLISGVEGGRWRQDGAIVIERETGAQYVYLDGSLQQVLNYASARLISGEGQVVRVAGRNLAGVPREPMVGIPGAPGSLPQGRTTGVPWTMCSVLGPDPAGSPSTTTTLLVGAPAPTGQPLDEHGMLVRDAEEGSTYLLWRSRRYRLTSDEPDQLIQSLYGARAPVVDVGAAWLNGLPPGQDIAPIDVPGRGEQSSAVEGWEVGALLYHEVTGGRQDFLVRHDGLASLTDLQALLLQGQYDVEPEPISPAVANAMRPSDVLAPASGAAAPPEAPPHLLPPPVDGRVTLCAETTGASSPPALSLGGDLTGTQTFLLPTGGESPEGTRLADSVVVPPGRIAVVRAMPSDTAAVGAFYLVTDAGIRFAVPTEEILTALGYSAAEAVEMPAALVQRIPAGPTLEPSAARQLVPVSQ
jgi:type VII secretion protein EccB